MIKDLFSYEFRAQRRVTVYKYLDNPSVYGNSNDSIYPIEYMGNIRDGGHYESWLLITTVEMPFSKQDPLPYLH